MSGDRLLRNQVLLLLLLLVPTCGLALRLFLPGIISRPSVVVGARAEIHRMAMEEEDLKAEELDAYLAIDARFREDLDTVLRQLGCEGRYVGESEVQTMLGYLESIRRRQPQKRIAPYLPHIVNVFRDYHVPEPLIFLPWVESQYVPEALSSAGARGLWQFMERTASTYGLRSSGHSEDQRLDWKRETEAAGRYLRSLLDIQHADWDPLLAIASYNRGEENIVDDLERYRSSSAASRERPPGESLFWALREAQLLPEETSEYVPRFLAASVFFEFPEHFPVQDGI